MRPFASRLAAVCSAAVVGSAVAASAQPDWSQVVTDVGPSVVTIDHATGGGSGFVVRGDGTIITNAHVIEDAAGVTVTLHTGEIFGDVWLVAADERRDLALIRIAGSGLRPLTVSSEPVAVGQPVALIGSPRGFENTLTTGVVSAERLMGGTQYVQTTAESSPGSSGSPLVTADGEVVGVLTLSRRDAEALNFAISARYIQGLLDSERLRGQATLFPPAPPEELAAAPPPAAEEELADPVRPRGAPYGVFLGGWPQNPSPTSGFWPVMRNVHDALFGFGVPIVNTAELLDWWQRGELAFGVSSAVLVDVAEEFFNAAWVIKIETDIHPSNRRDGASLECWSVPSGQLMWREDITDFSMSVDGSINDLSRDLVREVRERRGRACVTGAAGAR